MNPTAWLREKFPDSIPAKRLQRPRAKKLAALLATGGYSGAILTKCRRNPQSGHEVLVVDVDVGLGQRPTVNDVHSREAVALCFGEDAALPTAFALRKDFPSDVPHLNVVLTGYPRTFCLYNALPDEVRITYTALRFMERVRWWLRETAYGRLHGDDQPLDPLFHQVGLAFVLPADFSTNPHSAYVAKKVSPRPLSPLLLEPATPGSLGQLSPNQQGAFAAISLITNPIPHRSMRSLPGNLAELFSTYASVGADIRGPLVDAFVALLGLQGHNNLLQAPLLLLLTTARTRDGVAGPAESITTKAFVSRPDSSGQVAVALGALLNAHGHWARPVTSPPIGDLAAIKIIPADVYEGFHRALARQASGKSAIPDDPQVALLGAGALGSQIALTAARGGYGRWTIIDKDFLLPHNFARHALGPLHLGQAKADRVALEIQLLLGADAARSIVTDVTGPADENQNWPMILASMNFIVDASASVSVARWLAIDAERTAPAASCFLNVKGTDAVVFAEGEGGVPRLDHLEMSYYWRLINEHWLQGHLQRDSSALSVGACRTPSAQIPQTRVASLAALATEVLTQTPWPADGQIVLWRGSASGVARHTYAGEPFVLGQLRDWTVAVRRPMLMEIARARLQVGQCETGGILAGTWDRDRKIIYIVGHFDPPPDSQHEPTGFVRGTVGVHRTIEQVESATAGNLTYIGEWHTHPPGYGSAPSADDRHLLRWVHDALQWSDAPALILIAGEDGFRLVLLDEGSAYSEFLITTASLG